jgi:hypothetical protein
MCECEHKMRGERRNEEEEKNMKKENEICLRKRKKKMEDQLENWKIFLIYCPITIII